MNSFYFDKMHMLYNKKIMCEVVSKNIALKKQQHCFLKKKPLFSSMCTFYPIVLKLKIITVSTGNFQSYVTLISQTIALQFSLNLTLLYNLHCAGHTIIVIFNTYWYLKLSPKSQLHLISIIQRWFENNPDSKSAA